MKSIALIAAVLGYTTFTSACGGPVITSLATDTPAPGEPTPTPEPTSTPAPGSIGCRPYNVSQGKDGTGPTASYVAISALSGQDASEALGAGGIAASGPMGLCAGPLSSGQAPLTLQADVTMAISLPQSNCVCAQYLAAGSTGTLYCAASPSSPLDFTSTLASNNDAQPVPASVQTDGPGMVAHPGDARFTFQAKQTQISQSASGCTASACQTALASITAIHTVLYTTGNATSTITNAKQGGTVTVSLPGQPMSADTTGTCADWVSATTLGSLAGAAEQQENVSGAGGDLAIVERIGEVP